MTKYCTRCKTTKNVSEFNTHIRRSDGLQPYCKDCKRVLDREYYHSNAERKAAVRLRAQKATEVSFNKLMAYLLEHPCVDCGETDLYVLEFDHHTGVVNHRITSMVTMPWEVIEKELALCEVRCANCHTKVTHQRANTMRHRYIEQSPLV